MRSGEPPNYSEWHYLGKKWLRFIRRSRKLRPINYREESPDAMFCGEIAFYRNPRKSDFALATYSFFGNSIKMIAWGCRGELPTTWVKAVLLESGWHILDAEDRLELICRIEGLAVPQTIIIRVYEPNRQTDLVIQQKQGS